MGERLGKARLNMSRESRAEIRGTRFDLFNFQLINLLYGILECILIQKVAGSFRVGPKPNKFSRQLILRLQGGNANES